MTTAITTPRNLLDTASRQWATRPADERYATLADLKAAVSSRRSHSEQFTVTTSALHTVAEGEEVLVRGRHANATLTHWAFGQLARTAGAPAGYLRTLPAHIASNALNHGLASSTEKNTVLFTEGAKHPMIRAVTSDSYGRIWDADVVSLVESLTGDGGWAPPPAREVNGSSNAGLYASDHDVFTFLVNEGRRVEVGGEDLGRGFFCWNSEVGNRTFGICTFLYRYVCGNHIVWGAQDVREVRIKHYSRAPLRARRDEVGPWLRRYAERGTYAEVRLVQGAQRTLLAEKTEGVADFLRGKAGFTLTEAEQSLAYAKREEPNSDPRTLWAVANGATAYARDQQFNDDRFAIEAKTAKLLQGFKF